MLIRDNAADEYELVQALSKDDDCPHPYSSHPQQWFHSTRWRVRTCLVAAVCLITLIVAHQAVAQWNVRPLTRSHSTSNHVHLLQRWGQYSPYFDVPSEIASDLPHTCQYTFAQLLSRHGARYPTAFKSMSYQTLIDRLQADVQSWTAPYTFLDTYSYQLGADELTSFGQQEMVVSGKAFYDRYHDLTKNMLPFIRASGQHRVVVSAEKFSAGYFLANSADETAPATQPAPPVSVIISEEAGSNNTLSINTCPAFHTPPNTDIVTNAKATWAAIFAPPIQSRLNHDMAGANLTITETISLMDLCPFETVARTTTTSPLSPFCHLFTPAEWRKYNYYQTLDKYYGHSTGNPLAPTLGVGFVNELIARLTTTPVRDQTCTNHTLDSSHVTFPLDARLYADFSHDNDMEAIFAALGLYNDTAPLPLKEVRDAEQVAGFSAAWTVPFGARLYVEKMRCGGGGGEGVDGEYVRVLVNGRVMPLHGCGADGLGRCRLDEFVQSLGFARMGGGWDRCYGG